MTDQAVTRETPSVTFSSSKISTRTICNTVFLRNIVTILSVDYIVAWPPPPPPPTRNIHAKIWNSLYFKFRRAIILTAAARSKAWTIFARSNNGVVGSNSTRGMDVCVLLFYVCVVLCIGRGLATGWSPSQGVLPTCIGLRNWKGL
jgi:hypothetical protein